MVDQPVNQGIASQERENPQKRRSGLYGLSAIALALSNSRNEEYLDKLLVPVINSFEDKDSKVLLAACDSMFNIVRNYTDSILLNKNFLKIFNKVIFLISSSHNSDVKDYSKKVDDMLKDVVYRSLDLGMRFDLD